MFYKSIKKTHTWMITKIYDVDYDEKQKFKSTFAQKLSKVRQICHIKNIF